MQPTPEVEDGGDVEYHTLSAEGTGRVLLVDNEAVHAPSYRGALFTHFVAFAALLVYALCVNLTKTITSSVYILEKNPALSFPLVSSQVPVSMLVGICIGVPSAAIVLAVPFLRYNQTKTQAGSVFNACLILFLTLGQCLLMSDAITNTIKVLVLRPRPNFFARCDYKGFQTAMSSGNYTSYNAQTQANVQGSTSYCLAPQTTVVDSVLSFPSGHSSLSWAAMTFISLLVKYTIDQYSPFKILSPHGVLFAAPLYLSAWIAITRIQDYYHHTDDVMMGSFIGATTSIYVFRNGKELLDEFRCLRRGELKGQSRAA